jgi:putative ABC transport system ATP-binding protein
MAILITAKNLKKSYGKGKDTVHALGPIDFTVVEGSFTIILGKSGSGKSTLLNLLSGLDNATDGSLVVAGETLSKFKSAKLAKYRAKIGLIFQFYNLLPNLSTLENVMISSWLKGTAIAKQDAVDLLTQFGLGHRINSNIKTLSGGEKQRVAICRSLINKPEILFCDEPTGALDTANEQIVKDILVKLNKEGMTIVMVTHNEEFIPMADKVITMKDGLIESMNTNISK